MSRTFKATVTWNDYSTESGYSSVDPEELFKDVVNDTSDSIILVTKVENIEEVINGTESPGSK